MKRSNHVTRTTRQASSAASHEAVLKRQARPCGIPTGRHHTHRHMRVLKATESCVVYSLGRHHTHALRTCYFLYSLGPHHTPPHSPRALAYSSQGLDRAKGLSEERRSRVSCRCPGRGVGMLSVVKERQLRSRGVATPARRSSGAIIHY